MLKKYEYEEFLNMVKHDLENQEKSSLLPFDFPNETELIPPVRDKEIIDTVYHLLSVCPDYYIDTSIELDNKYNMWLWSKTYKQIEALFPDLRREQILRIVRYVRTKFIYDEIKKIITNEGGHCDYCVYSDSDEKFVLNERCPKIFLQQIWVEEDDEEFYFRILPSSMGFFSYQVREEDVFPGKVPSDPLDFREIRTLSGLTQQAFSEKYEIPKRTVEDWESGRRNPPGYVIALLERAVKEDFSR
ncbi:MAG: helix-turn-helix domain-containing protein [Blautia massiliensis (ex Durand et al. 2017)]|uniref:helix-turn-helix domain-containing protein n=1 Tax=Blautia massiliensis (ex Durand et al. 2017) TaxID=1737424 RepID=UPI00399521DB